MQRLSSTFIFLAAAALSGCVSTPVPSLAMTDPIDGLIAKNAAAVTQALRELSESTGGSRVVTSQRPTMKASVTVVAPLNIGSSRMGAVAIEPGFVTQQATPQAHPLPPQQIVATNSGVVASGGLLSVPPPGLERLMTVRWTGDLDQLLSRVAQDAGWKMGESTGFRVVPVIISISADNRSAFDLLRDIGAIAGTSADIMVSTTTRTISVRYLKR